MAERRRVTEEDVRVTEALIADSFDRLKSSIAHAPGDALRPALDVVREHPFAATATAVGAGALAYKLLRMAAPRSRSGAKGRSLKSSMASQLLALATPYVASYLEQQLGRALAGRKES